MCSPVRSTAASTPDRAATTTQRRLKRLSDAGWVGGCSFIAATAAGCPCATRSRRPGSSCCAYHGRLDGVSGRGRESGCGTVEEQRAAPGAPRRARGRLGARPGADARLALRYDSKGAAVSVLSPPLYSTPNGRPALGPRELRLPGGRTPHEFLRPPTTPGTRARWSDSRRCVPTRPSRSRGSGQHARRRRPRRGRRTHTRLAASPSSRCGRARRARRSPAQPAARRRSWSATTICSRAGACTPNAMASRPLATPLVVFVCRDRARARECARSADRVLTACRAYAGEYPADWEYPGRAGVLFAAERDIHEGSLLAYAGAPAAAGGARGGRPRRSPRSARRRCGREHPADQEGQWRA